MLVLSCFGSYLGIIIALLAIVISVGVGLIVHFAENRALECNFPVVRGDDGSVVQAQSGGKATQQQAATTGKSHLHTSSIS